jgi:hypothetical protein
LWNKDFVEEEEEEAHKKLAQLENIKNNSKNYQKIERIAEQKAKANKKVIAG